MFLPVHKKVKYRCSEEESFNDLREEVAELTIARRDCIRQGNDTNENPDENMVKEAVAAGADIIMLDNMTHEQMKEAFCELEARHLSEQSDVDQETALRLVKDGYEGHDIRAAAVLAKESGKDIQSVLDMKKINNHWHDVAAALGVDAHGLHLDSGYGPAMPSDDFDGDL